MATAAKQAKIQEQVQELEEFDWATTYIINGIKQGIKEADLIMQGKMDAVTTEELLGEIEQEYQQLTGDQ